MIKLAEEFEKILGADNGNPPDSLRQMYPKVNRNFDRVKAWFTSTLSLINGHIQSAAAHLSEHITYSGAAPGANVKQGIDNTYNRISEIVAQAGDDNTEIVDARGSYPVLGDRLNASDAHLAENLQLMQNLFVASWHGVDSSIGDADATDALNGLFTAAKAAGKRYIYFDDPHTYKVSGELAAARDLILLGLAEIDSSSLENYYIQICKSFESYNGKYNSVAPGNTSFNQFITALTENRNIKVTIWGDSISTGGGDCLNMSFNGTNSGQDFSENSPQGLTRGDAYYHRLIDLLSSTFKNRVFDFYNRAIGSTTIQQWDSSQTFNSTTKVWIDHIKDTQCDLLIIAFGMNNSSYSSAKGFKYYLQQIMNYIEANFTTVPTVALVTTPRPTMALDDTWGGSEGQLARDMAAYQARKYGYERGCYIIDVNKISNVKRAGKSFENVFLKELAVTESEVDNIISGTYTKVGSEYVIQNSGIYLQINKYLKDFTFQFDVKLTNFPVSTENLWLAFNALSGLENVILFSPNYTGGLGRVSMYENYADSSHFPAGKFWNDTVAWNDGTYRTIRIEKRDDVVDVFINNVRKMRGRFQINNLPGYVSLRKNSGDVGVITLQNLKIYEGVYPHKKPTLTEYEMWGLHEDGAYGTKPVIGGNGVNHPSTIGLEEVYVPALKEFVDDLGKASWFA